MELSLDEALDTTITEPGPDSENAAEVPGLEGTDATELALKQFELIDRNELVGVTSEGPVHEESIPCQCQYKAGDPAALACGESSDCINRLVQMECNVLTCPCGSFCQNRRFQKRQYAAVRVVWAGRKGFGLQAEQALESGQFVMEYMGEVVSAAQFRRRAEAYGREGITHHYFMSIGSSKVIDATRKGSVARFINHSCGPNCVLQKWMVGGAVRMGIFADRPIARGEELTFDYKFERLPDTAPQPCYCGAQECKGVIGVAKRRRQQQSAPSSGVEDEIADEIADHAVTRRQRDRIRRRHAAVESDESDYSDGAEDTRRGLTSPEQVLKFVQIMHRSAGETRAITILVTKLMETTDRRLLKSLIGLHAAGILRAWLLDYRDRGDDAMVTKLLQCVAHLPISTRNTIEESKLEDAVAPLCTYGDETVAAMAADLVSRWKLLRRVFKIPKKAPARPAPGRLRGSASPAPDCTHSSTSSYANSPSRAPHSRFRSRSPPKYRRIHSYSHLGTASFRPARSDRNASQPNTRPARNDINAPQTTTSFSQVTSRPFYNDTSRPFYNDTSRPLHNDTSRPLHNDTSRPFHNDTSRPIHNDINTSHPNSSRSPSRTEPCSLPSQIVQVPQDRLMPGWRVAYAGEGLPYYYHETTKETRWEPPVVEATQDSKYTSLLSPTDDVKINGVSKAKVDEIIERAMKQGAQNTEVHQLVTPETDGERAKDRDTARENATKLEKRATSEVASYVVRILSKYRSQLAHDQFKHEAKKITKILMEKERKSAAFDPHRLLELSVHKKAKIKKFVAEYVKSLIARKPKSYP